MNFEPLIVKNYPRLIFTTKWNISKEAMRDRLFVLTIFSCLVPYFGIIRLPSDIQPYYFLFSGAGILLNLPKYRSISVYSVPFLLMTLVASVSLLLTIVQVSARDFFSLFRFYFPYISIPTLIIYLFKERERFQRDSLVKILDATLMVIFVSLVFNVVGLSRINSLFVNRAAFDIGHTSRGLVGIFSEQSHLAIHMSFFFVLYYYLGALTKKRIAVLFVFSLSSLVGQFFIEVMVLSLALTVGYVYRVAATYLVNKKILALATAGVILLGLGVYFVINMEVGNIRVANLIKEASRDLPHLIGSDGSIIYKISGLLLAISTLAADPLNFQLGSSQFSEISARLGEFNHDFHMFLFGVAKPVYPPSTYSAFGTWIVDFGIVGLLCYMIVLAMFGYKVLLSRNKMITLTVFVHFLYISILKIPLSNPTVFLVFCCIVLLDPLRPKKVIAGQPNR